MPRRTRPQSQVQNQPFSSQNQPQASDPPQRPRKKTAAGPTDIDLAQVVSRHAQLEEMVEDTNQAVHTIKQLLERMAALINPTNHRRPDYCLRAVCRAASCKGHHAW